MTDTAPLTDEQLDAIRQRVPNHYPAPWRFEHGDDGSWSVVYPSDSPLAGLVATVPDYGYDLAEFLAHVRVDVPALLAEVDRLRAELAQEQQVSQERGRYLAEVDAALIAAGEDEGGGYIAYARRIAQLAADRDRARAELTTARQQIAAGIRAYCPDHGTADTCRMDCHCAIADELTTAGSTT